MGMFKEFKEFSIKGNVVDLAIGVIIGSAFGKIISSFVSDVIMPPIGLLLGGVNFTALKLTLKAASVDASGKAVEAVSMNYGSFIQTTLDFLIIAFCIFMVIKGINSFKKKEEVKPAAPPQPTDEVKLLGEIRDLLKK